MPNIYLINWMNGCFAEADNYLVLPQHSHKLRFRALTPFHSNGSMTGCSIIQLKTHCHQLDAKQHILYKYCQTLLCALALAVFTLHCYRRSHRFTFIHCSSISDPACYKVFCNVSIKIMFIQCLKVRTTVPHLIKCKKGD